MLAGMSFIVVVGIFVRIAFSLPSLPSWRDIRMYPIYIDLFMQTYMTYTHTDVDADRSVEINIDLLR